MSDTNATTISNADQPIRLCSRTRWACPLYTNCKSCGGRYARPCDRIEKLARLILRVRFTDRYRGHAGDGEQNLARVDLEQLLGEILWDECRLAVVEAGPDGVANWDDPRVRQDAHDLCDDLMANARRAVERDDYARRPHPTDPNRTPPAGGTGLSVGGVAARSDDLAWSLLAGAIRQARRLDARRAA